MLRSERDDRRRAAECRRHRRRVEIVCAHHDPCRRALLDMTVAVDAARQHQAPGCVDFPRTGTETFAKRRDDAFLDGDIANRCIGGGGHRAVGGPPGQSRSCSILSYRSTTPLLSAAGQALLWRIETSSKGMAMTAAASSHRPTIAVTQHAISAGHYLAATAGFDILQSGGNAIDAGCAAGIALGVLQSDLVDVAGVAPILVYLADKQEVVTIAGLGPWPKALDPELFQREHGAKFRKGCSGLWSLQLPTHGSQRSGATGTMSFSEVAAAAIRLARDGFPMYPLMAESLKRPREGPPRLAVDCGDFFAKRASPRARRSVPPDRPRRIAAIYGRRGAFCSIARPGEAGLEAARDAFYRGDIAQKIVELHEAGGRAPFGGGPCRIPFAGRPARAAALWRS